uniref:Uncharacterized protein n=1 Tax=Anguilla anguilla TaxID=7936 RepID=A0A0E9PJ60_ANGAN
MFLREPRVNQTRRSALGLTATAYKGKPLCRETAERGDEI